MRRNAHTDHRPKECRIGVEKFGWEMAALQQRLRSVKIFENQTQQPRALNDSLLDIPPLIGGNQEWNNINLPWPIGAERIAVDVVGDAIL